MLTLSICLLTGCGESSPGGSPLNSQEAQPSPMSAGESRTLAGRAAMVRRVPMRVRVAFAPFRSPPEGLPGRVTQVLRRPMGGTNWKLSQRLSTTAGPTVWAVPGRGLTCLVSQERENSEVITACTHTRRTVENGIFLVSLARLTASIGRTGRFVVGMVPDGTRSVRVYTPGLPIETAAVTNGTFTLLDDATDPPGRILLLP